MSNNRLHIPTLYHLALGSLLSCLVFSHMACLTGSWDRVKESQDVDELMRFVHEFPKDPNAADALRRVELLHYRDAVAANTLYAYRLFLRRHPGSVHAIEIKHRFEDLGFEVARRENDLVALKTFLDHWPHGRFSSRAAELIVEIACKNLLGSRDPAAISKFVKTNPAAPCKDELQTLAEKLLFTRARDSGGVRELLEFIDSNPAVRFTQMARRTVVTRQVSALLKAARFEQAKRLVAGLAGAPAQSVLMKTIEQARLDWISSSFDPRAMLAELENLPADSASRVHRRAAVIQRRPRIFGPLANATGILKSPLATLAGVADLRDPRDHWMHIDRLALLPDEQCAGLLLAALADSFLEVRRQALRSLREVLERFGEVRSESWLHAKTAAIEAKARSGALLLKLAVLRALAGDKERALEMLMRETENTGSEDIFPGYLAARLSAELDNEKRAATMAKRFSDTVRQFCNDRVTAWREGGLAGSPNGWLTLRQLFGATRLWNEVLAPFGYGKVSKARISAFESFLGPWLERSGNALDATRAFLDQAESGWASSHAGYDLSASRHGIGPRRDQAAPGEKEALSRLAFCGRTAALTSLSWAACCHPRKETRRLAASMKLQADLVSRVALLWPLLDCGR